MSSKTYRIGCATLDKHNKQTLSTIITITEDEYKRYFPEFYKKMVANTCKNKGDFND